MNFKKNYLKNETYFYMSINFSLKLFKLNDY